MAEAIKGTAPTRIGAKEMKCPSPFFTSRMYFIPESSNWWQDAIRLNYGCLLKLVPLRPRSGRAHPGDSRRQF